MKRLIRTSAHVVFVSALLGGVSFASQTVRSPTTSEQLTPGYQREERAFLTDQEKTMDAKQLRQSLLRKARDTHQQLQTLAELTTSFSHRMDTLLDSDTGKRIVRDGVCFMTYVNLRDYPAATMNEITPKTDAASALLSCLQLTEQGPDVGFVPSAKTQQEVDELQTWTKAKLAILENHIAALDTIIRTAPQDIDPNQTKQLRTAVQEHQARWTTMVSEYQARGQKLASQNVSETLLLAAYQAELERAKFEYGQMLARMQAEIDKLNQEFQVALLKQKQQAAEELSAAKVQYDNKLAEIQRNEKAAETDRAVKDRTAAIDRNTKIEAMNHQEQIALAKSAEVQQLLAPFTAPGYWQPRVRGPSYDKKPVSLTQLKITGALSQTPAGLKALLDCGMTKADRERPRWSFRTGYVNLTDAEHTRLVQAQEYLIELGDILVELGMLSK